MAQKTGITARTALLGVIGHPVSHSLSPIFQNVALQALGLDYVYLAFDILPDDLFLAIRSLRTWRLQGINVTIPHKKTIVTWLDRLDKTASQLEAVNVVVVKEEELVGYNTDGIGFAKALEFNHIELKGKNVILLGAGGAARAVLSVLIKSGVHRIIVYNRSYQRCYQLQQWAQNSLNWSLEIDNWENFINGDSSFLSQADLLINTPQFSIFPQGIDVPWEKMENCEVLIDVVYCQEETSLVKEARKRGKKAFDGKMMLLFQGAESFRLFTGIEAPFDIMERALSEAIS